MPRSEGLKTIDDVRRGVNFEVGEVTITRIFCKTPWTRCELPEPGIFADWRRQRLRTHRLFDFFASRGMPQYEKHVSAKSELMVKLVLAFLQDCNDVEAIQIGWPPQNTVCRRQKGHEDIFKFGVLKPRWSLDLKTFDHEGLLCKSSAQTATKSSGSRESSRFNLSVRGGLSPLLPGGQTLK
ncbi:hypothetical protein SCHPADRAFT_928580 [Schizopora paradoxa]|uniref:Uncharacterized protein n=1 Tax=Schizopora paradoxa TaxID=27342 RepID=A0A0H2RVI1_9AGAM|nr:hypothetical protein SCHPADRAFT_928580 [Schizopora paradoxa]